MRSLLRACAVLAVLVGTASAAPTEQSQAIFAEGQAAYLAGNYLEAAAKFEAAYALDRDTAYLFNIGQAYRLGRSCAKAVEYFRRFQAEAPSLPEAQQQQLTHFLHESETCATDQERERLQKSGAYASAARQRRARIIGGLIAGVGGGLGLGTGIYFSIRGNSLEDDRQRLCADGCNWADKAVEADDLESSGKRANVLAVTGYAVGGAAIVGGVLYMMFAGRSDEVAVTPVAGGAVVSRRIEF